MPPHTTLPRALFEYDLKLMDKFNGSANAVWRWLLALSFGWFSNSPNHWFGRWLLDCRSQCCCSAACCCCCCFWWVCVRGQAGPGQTNCKWGNDLGSNWFMRFEAMSDSQLGTWVACFSARVCNVFNPDFQNWFNFYNFQKVALGEILWGWYLEILYKQKIYIWLSIYLFWVSFIWNKQ